MSKVWIIVLIVVGILVLGGAGLVGYKMLYPQALPTVSLPMVKVPSATPSAAKAPNQITLQITQPTNGQVLSAATVKVTGKTAANADVSVNDKDVKADASGNFTATINLEEGDNPIMVTAFDADGNTSEQEITVTYQVAGQ
ncbi:cadherin-like beta sandwich domain-containing protein [Candidatus Gottesmanbacteria bacterium]|nr:cadherin-like beta sandwich domain-containing protein [Candidatus Gottesmanbacteria bacterium]